MSFNFSWNTNKNDTPSVTQRLSDFDQAQILRNVMKKELKKLVQCEFYFYILVL